MLEALPALLALTAVVMALLLAAVRLEFLELDTLVDLLLQEPFQHFKECKVVALV